MRVIAHLLARLHQEERGSVLLVVLAFLPVAIGAAAFVIDMGNGAEHRRHLQLQADAGALAAAQELNGCFLNKTAANADAQTQALSYSGANHNAQIGGSDAQGRVQTKINATTYDTASYSEGTPCDTGVVDVRLIEADSPPVFAFLNDTDFRAHARVKVLTLTTSGRMLPIAVQDPDPSKAAAQFVDEATGTILASTSLTQTTSQNGMKIWDNSAAPVSVPITAENVGLRVALGGGSSTTCGGDLVKCYDLSSTTRGLVHIRGWTARLTTGDPAGATNPVARSVTLLPGPAVGGCPDPYFVNASVSCTIGINATLDFGVSATTLGTVTVAATVGADRYPLSFNAATGVATGTGIVIPAGAGPEDIGLHWKTTVNPGGNCNGGKCEKDILAVHRSLSRTDAVAGPIGLAQVTEDGVTPAGATANTFQRCSSNTTPPVTNCTHKLVAKIGVVGKLDLSAANGPPVRLRVAVDNGSQTQSLDCDPKANTSLRDQLINGCNPLYRAHTASDAACPDAATLKARANPPAWDCVAVSTGNKTNQIAQGLNQRIFGTQNPTSCTSPNHWPNWADDLGDPRIIFVLIAPFGTFSGSGSSETVPVNGFATFYVTGWTGSGSGDNPCIGHGDDAPGDAGEIVGRFIQYVEIPNNGGAGGEACDFNAIDPCVAVLVQ
jgi:Flp pilus assembly protein TadG